MEFVEVTAEIEEPRFLNLLAFAVGYPTAEKLAAIASAYRTLPGRKAFALIDGPSVLGVIGLEASGSAAARVRHIAVAEASRRRGVGRRLLNDACAAGFTALVAETDRDAVGFYRACGFTVQSLGERFPDGERFACTLGAA
jgi:ribosomal protein S18 acetylase RimI-like enzyme